MNPNTMNRQKMTPNSVFDTYGMMKSSDDSNNLDDTFENDVILKIPAQDEMENFENEIFCDKFYKYTALELLEEAELCIEDSIEPIIHICAFQVNTEGKYPFLQFIMHKKINEDNIIFPQFVHNQEIDPLIKAESVIEFAISFYQTNGITDYKGYLTDEKKENFYLFFDCSTYEIGVHDLYRNNEMWLLSIDELLNTREVCGSIRVDETVSAFFEKYSDFIYLQDSENKNYEIPVIAYVGTTESKSNFVSTFGNGQSDDKSIFGPNYYFYDFNASAKMAIEQSKNKKINEKIITLTNWLETSNSEMPCVIRFAIFMGKTKVVTNSSVDSQDSSETTLEMLKEDVTCSKLSHRQLINYLKITDRGNNWVEEYDSIFLAEGVKLDDESVLNHSNTYSLKKYEQQLVLSCHFLDSKNLLFIK